MVSPPLRICRRSPLVNEATDRSDPSVLVKAIREPSGDGIPFLAPDATCSGLPPSAGHHPNPGSYLSRAPAMDPLIRILEPSLNQTIRSTCSPLRVSRGWLLPSLIRRRYTGPPNVANNSVFPSGERAAAVTRFSFTCRVNCRNSGSLLEIDLSRNA